MITIILFLILLPLSLQAQEIQPYLEYIKNGEIDRVKGELPILFQKYGETPGLMFLRGMVETDPDLALSIFKEIAQKYPNSPWADDAMMKVGEYFYSRGLYNQAAEYLKKIPIYYSYSIHVEKSVILLITALEVSGKQDSADFYRQIFSLKYPGMDFRNPVNLPYEVPDWKTVKAKKTGWRQGKSVASTTKIDTLDKVNKMFADLEKKIKKVLSNKGEIEGAGVKSKDTIEEKGNRKNGYSVQLGAFSKKVNAINLKKRFESQGYDVYIMEIRKGNMTLYGVRIGYFETREEARSFGEELKRKHSLADYLVVRSNRE